MSGPGVRAGSPVRAGDADGTDRLRYGRAALGWDDRARRTGSGATGGRTGAGAGLAVEIVAVLGGVVMAASFFVLFTREKRVEEEFMC